MSDSSKFLIQSLDLPAEWMRDLARNVQSPDYIDGIKRAAETIDGCVEASKRKCGGVLKVSKRQRRSCTVSTCLP